MGRASRAKRLRREAQAAVIVAPVNRGGRPRIYEDAAAKQRAYRLRKKLGVTPPEPAAAATVEPSSATGEAASYDSDPWLASPEYLRWLLATAKELGDDWLEAQLEVEAEAAAAGEFDA